jgi:hypothetical protein
MQGAIYRLRWCGHDAADLLVVAEDRTVRCWRGVLRQDCACVSLCHIAARAPAHCVRVPLHARACRPECALRVMGHGARVWDALQLRDGRLLSCGEDGACLLWSAAGASWPLLRASFHLSCRRRASGELSRGAWWRTARGL